MTTKYAKARDVAGQWKSELRKVQRENRSLRRVYAAARDLHDEIALHTQLTGQRPPDMVLAAARDLKDALRNAMFAEVPRAAASLGAKEPRTSALDAMAENERELGPSAEDGAEGVRNA
jgi:hypothetical protein